MRSFATLAAPGTFTLSGGLLVGRTVANSQFLQAMVRYSSFEEICLLIGEQADFTALQELIAPWKIQDKRLVIYSLWQLPALLSHSMIDVLHHTSHVDKLYDLMALRDRYAAKPTPVTGQIHSISYPRMQQEYARALFIPPAATDAIFSSSTAGRIAMQQAFLQISSQARLRGMHDNLPTWSFPLVPLGVNVDANVGGDRLTTRRLLKIPDDATVLLSIARFTEYDKVDLFPLLQVVSQLVRSELDRRSPIYIVLAGARQGTKTPEMLELWAKVLGITDRLRLRIDFADADKKDLFAAADIFVSPVDNVQETFGQSVVEAMAAGLPVVVSDFDGYKDTVDESVGYRVPTRFTMNFDELSELAPLLYERPLHLVLGQSVEVDLRILEKALAHLIAGPEKRKAMGEAAQKKAKTCYDWSKVIPQYDAVWKQLRRAGSEQHAGTSHPLRLDYGATFGHFATEPMKPDAVLVRSQLSRSNDKSWVIYPELKALIRDDDVKAALSFALVKRSHQEMVTALEAKLGDRPQWVASFIVGWLVKHGLLERVE